MHTEAFCTTLDKLDRVKAIRAIQEAFLQLSALTTYADCGHYDNRPALNSLLECLRDAGHPAGENFK